MSLETTIAELLKIRETAVDDIRNAGGRPDREWLEDRTRDIEYANRKLRQLGAV